MFDKIDMEELKVFLYEMKDAQHLSCGEDIEAEEKRILKEVLRYLDQCGIGDGILKEILAASEYQF